MRPQLSRRTRTAAPWEAAHHCARHEPAGQGSSAPWVAARRRWGAACAARATTPHKRACAPARAPRLPPRARAAASPAPVPRAAHSCLRAAIAPPPPQRTAPAARGTRFEAGAADAQIDAQTCPLRWPTSRRPGSASGASRRAVSSPNAPDAAPQRRTRPPTPEPNPETRAARLSKTKQRTQSRRPYKHTGPGRGRGRPHDATAGDRRTPAVLTTCVRVCACGEGTRAHEPRHNQSPRLFGPRRRGSVCLGAEGRWALARRRLRSLGWRSCSATPMIASCCSRASPSARRPARPSLA